jgi:hypothetical protein
MFGVKSIIDSVVEAEEEVTRHSDSAGTVWYMNRQGLLYRTDGPAIEWADGTKFWYINDIRFTEDEFNQFVDPITGQVTIPLGYKLTYEPEPDE